MEQMAALLALQKDPDLRDREDLEQLFYLLRSFNSLGNLRDNAVRTLCGVVRYEYHDANEVLFCRGDVCNCWYILLSGSAFIESTMYLPYHCFGKRAGNTCRRTNECVILEPSEMIAIDYPEVQMVRQRNGLSLGMDSGIPCSPALLRVARERLLSDNTAQMALSSSDLLQSSSYLPSCDRSSRGSDTSSGAFSAASDLPVSHRHDSTADTDSEDEVDLIEDMPDGDESISASSCTFRDTVRDCLERDPMDRSEDDVEALLDFMQRLPAFASFTQSVRQRLCQVMVFASVEKAGTVVMVDGEELDSWSVLINGSVLIEFPDGQMHELHVGDCFGITPTMEKLYHRGTMRTKSDDCQFVCVAQADYYHIINQGEEHTRKIEGEDGQVVMVVENRILDAGGRRGPVVIKAVAERLIAYLIEEHSMTDPWYIEDLLLTYRTFLSSPTEIADRLLTWYSDPSLRDRATRIVLLWVNNHFIDFESHPPMMSFLEQFQFSLESQKKSSQLRLLHIACAAKARERCVTLTRSTREESLNFSILGGWDRGFGIYICDVKRTSRAEELGLRRGDQILQVNGVRFEHITHGKALEVLRGATHLSVTVRSNLLGYREMLTTPADSPRHRHRHRRNPQVDLVGHGNRMSGSDLDVMDVESPQSAPVLLGLKGAQDTEGKKGFMTMGHKARLRKALVKMNILSKNQSGDFPDSAAPYLPPISTDPTGGSLVGAQKLHHSRSNPDLFAATSLDDPVSTKDPVPPSCEFAEDVLKVYKGDQTCKHLLVHKETTARQVVMLALAEFGITDPSHEFSLCQVSVEAGNVIKQRRLPDEIQGLAETIPLNGRYYLKNNRLQETLVADDIAPEIWRESQTSLLQLNTLELAAQITLQDFAIFKQIEPTEYIDELFHRQPTTSANLHKFENLVNREMFWVITEVCSEPQAVRRAKILKHFIKIAKHCHDVKNINSCFAILSGLNHGCVQRLKVTWEKVPQKYMKMFESLSSMMDPSRNMSKYRHLLVKWSVAPPIIPFYPVVRKDLTFLHEGNVSHEGKLINFEKLRMISKEIRQLKQFTSCPYYLNEMFDGACAPSVITLPSSRKNHGSRSLPSRKKITTALNVSAKKLYEEAQMVRKVKQYWSNVEIIQDEDRLHEMSLSCETSSNPARRQVSVPEPQVQTPQHFGPKFGQQSQNAVQKLMALSDASKVRQHSGFPGRSQQRPGLPRSPATSPKPPMSRHCHHSRALSDSQGSFGSTLRPPYSVSQMIPVDLSAESSSVTANVVSLRKSQSGSVTSAESVSATSVADSGLASSSHGSRSSSVNSSPSLNRPPTPPIHVTQIHVMPHPCIRGHRNNRAPPVPPPPPQLPPRELTVSYIRPRAPRPPDYQVATMSRQKPFSNGSSNGYKPSNAVVIPGNGRRPALNEVLADADGNASTV